MNYGMDYQGGGPSGGGGFDGGNSGGGGGGGGGSVRKSYDQQTIQPITIHMALAARPDESSESTGGLELQDGRKLYHVRIVGATRSVETTSTSTVYKIEDGTGLIEVKQWLEGNECTAVQELKTKTNQEHIYVKVVGQLKDYNEKKMIVANSIRPLSTGNELTHHMLEVVYTTESFKRQNQYGIPQHQSDVMMANNGSALRNSTGRPLSMSNSNNNSDDSELHNAVIGFFQTHEGEEGARVDECIKALFHRFPEASVRSMIETLSAEGTVYSTIDDFTYKLA